MAKNTRWSKALTLFAALTLVPLLVILAVATFEYHRAHGSIDESPVLNCRRDVTLFLQTDTTDYIRCTCTVKLPQDFYKGYQGCWYGKGKDEKSAFV